MKKTKENNKLRILDAISYGLKHIRPFELGILLAIFVSFITFLILTNNGMLLRNLSFDIASVGLTISVTMFGVLFTGNAIFQSLLSGDLLQALLKTKRGQSNAYQDLSLNLTFGIVVSLFSFINFVALLFVVYLVKYLNTSVAWARYPVFIWLAISVTLIAYTFIEALNLTSNLNTIVHVKGLIEDSLNGNKDSNA